MRRFAVVLVLGAVVVAGACAPPVAQESGEIMALSSEWIEALNSADVDRLVGMYTPDARVLPPNAAMAQGSDAVRASFGEMIDAGLTAHLQSIEAISAGDVAYHVGRFTVFTPDGTEADRGKFIETWRRTGGEWKITNDIWNSDLVPATGGTTLVATHEVDDFDHWISAWRGDGSRRAMFAEHGAPAVRTMQSMSRPNLVALMIEVSDMEGFQAFLESPEGVAAKAEDGVRDPTLRIFQLVE